MAKFSVRSKNRVISSVSAFVGKECKRVVLHSPNIGWEETSQLKLPDTDVAHLRFTHSELGFNPSMSSVT